MSQPELLPLLEREAKTRGDVVALSAEEYQTVRRFLLGEGVELAALAKISRKAAPLIDVAQMMEVRGEREVNDPALFDAMVQELLGCAWGRGIAMPGDAEPCGEKAVQIVVLHDGGLQAPFKLCARHRDLVLQETEEHRED